VFTSKFVDYLQYMANLIECEVADDVKEFVIAAAQHVNNTSGKSYHVSDVMSCEDAGEGGKKLKLVMVRQPSIPRALTRTAHALQCANSWLKSKKVLGSADAAAVGCYGAAEMRRYGYHGDSGCREYIL